MVGFKEPPTPPWTFDGRRRPEPSFWTPYMHRRTAGAVPASVHEVTRLCGAVAVQRGARRLVVPSAVRYRSTGPLWWNSVWFVGGGGQVQEDDLPVKKDLRFILKRQA